MQAAPIRVVFVVTALTAGGAEMMLWKLLSRIDRSRFEPRVVALSGDTAGMLPSFVQIRVPCDSLGMRPGIGSMAQLARLRRMVRAWAPDIVQGWMYHGNVAASLACAFLRPPLPVLWNVRATLIEPAHNKRLTAFTIWASGKLAFSAARIINNSVASAIEHEQHFGYRASKRVILPNGFDTDTFRPSTDARLSIRHSLGLPPGALLIGLIGRYHPMKDHAGFLRAASLLRERCPDAQYVLAGERIDHANAELMRWVQVRGLSSHVHLLGQRSDMETVTAALDVAVSSSSSGEGFPNVIGEAMSCGVPCVVTDVGDSASIVGDTGRSVPPRDAEALARALEELVTMRTAERMVLGERARRRIIEHFSLDSIVRQYEHLYAEVHNLSARAGQT